jgi:uncharacterized repeat protein (TIGR01451 family)
MKMNITKIITLMIATLLLSSFAMAATVSRDMPLRVDPGTTVTVKLLINNIQTDAGKSIAIEDTLPSGTTITDWSITGTSQQKSAITTRFASSRAGWDFIPSGTSATITYTVNMPQTQSIYTFGPLLWFDTSGLSPQGAGVNQVAVRYVVCGDKICEAAESSDNCQADCPLPTTTTVQETTTTTQSTTTTLEVKDNVLNPPELDRSSKPLFILLILVLLVILLVFFWHTRKKKKLHAYNL